MTAAHLHARYIVTAETLSLLLTGAPHALDALRQELGQLADPLQRHGAGHEYQRLRSLGVGHYPAAVLAECRRTG